MPKSPQTENGHIDVANELGEALARVNLSAYESRVLWALLRRTYGWHKHCDHISYTQWEKLTKLNRWHIARTLASLQKRLIILIFAIRGKLLYGLQKDYDMWLPPQEREPHLSPLPIEVTLDKEKKVMSVTHMGNPPLPLWVMELAQAVLPKWATKVLPLWVNTKEKKESIYIKEKDIKKETPPPTPVEKEILSVIDKMPGWTFSEPEDLDWLRELTKEYENVAAAKLKGCRDYYSEKPTKKGPWKNRIRQWLQHDIQFISEKKPQGGGPTKLLSNPELKAAWDKYGKGG